VDLSGVGVFQKQVLAACASIPKGEVRPYGWIASEIGNPGSVRAVGTALGRNPIPLVIPCHRVVRSDGAVGNYAFGAERKHDLLVREGALLV
jgi:O-6-methylguanine DNA methyltransferase